jgi:NADPH-dependent curcumin reductase CurA
MSDTVNRQVLLIEKPTGKLGPEHFKLSKGSMPEPKDGEVLLKVRYISLDAANRAWMHGATYRAAVEANTVMAGGGIAEVVSSKAPGFAPGDIAFGDTGWQDYAVVSARHLTKMPKVEPMTHCSASTASPGSPPISGCSTSESRKPARPSWSPLPRARSDRSSARSPGSRGAASSVSPAARTSATG